MSVVDAPDIHDFIGYEFTYVKGDLSDSQSREALVDTAAKKGKLIQRDFYDVRNNTEKGEI